jgi:hypothetical protein
MYVRGTLGRLGGLGFLPPPYTSVGCIEEVNGCWDAMIAPKIVIDLDAGSTVDVWEVLDEMSRFAA